MACSRPAGDEELRRAGSRGGAATGRGAARGWPRSIRRRRAAAPTTCARGTRPKFTHDGQADFGLATDVGHARVRRVARIRAPPSRSRGRAGTAARVLSTASIGVDAMLARAGSTKCAAPRVAAPLSREAARQRGYRELLAHLDASSGTGVGRNRRTDPHARGSSEQLTWFRHLPTLVPVAADAPDAAEQVLKRWGLAESKT